jgi:hypothetical protein
LRSVPSLLGPRRRSKMKTKDGLMVVTGFLAILLGAMPLNGYFGFMRDPGSFHQDGFIGSAWHLLVGIVPFGMGVLFLAFSRASTRQVFLVPLCGIPAGLVLSLPAIVTGNGDSPWLAWLSIVAVGCVLAVLVHAATSTWHNRTLNPRGNGNRVQ